MNALPEAFAQEVKAAFAQEVKAAQEVEASAEANAEAKSAEIEGCVEGEAHVESSNMRSPSTPVSLFHPQYVNSPMSPITPTSFWNEVNTAPDCAFSPSLLPS